VNISDDLHLQVRSAMPAHGDERRQRCVTTMNAVAQRARDEAPHVPEAVARPVEYLVCCLPERHINYRSFVIRVVRHGADRWAVERHMRYLSADQDW
jgi:hypothetical protein